MGAFYSKRVSKENKMFYFLVWNSATYNNCAYEKLSPLIFIVSKGSTCLEGYKWSLTLKKYLKSEEKFDKSDDYHLYI